jgi:hypothetical protein
MKRVLIIHGFRSSPENGFKPWLRDELSSRNFKVEIPTMPHPDAPVMEQWLETLEHLVPDPDRHLILLGHSLGCAAILRYLERLKPGTKVGGAVLVAGPASSVNPAIRSFYQSPFDWTSIRQHCDRFVAIHSDNDPHVPLADAAIYKTHLDAQVIVERDKGHFSGSEGCRKLTSALQALLSF